MELEHAHINGSEHERQLLYSCKVYAALALRGSRDAGSNFEDPSIRISLKDTKAAKCLAALLSIPWSARKTAHETKIPSLLVVYSFWATSRADAHRIRPKSASRSVNA